MLDIVLGIIFISISLFVWISASSFPSATVMEGLGPDFLPVLLSIILIGLSVLLIISGIAKLLRKNSNEEKITIFNFNELKIPGILIILIFIYLILIKHLGFLIMTPILLFFTMKIMNAKNNVSILVSISFTLVTYLVFSIGLGVRLPLGIISIVLNQ